MRRWRSTLSWAAFTESLQLSRMPVFRDGVGRNGGVVRTVGPFGKGVVIKVFSSSRSSQAAARLPTRRP